MTIDKAMELLSSEKECLKRHPKCGMDCEKCGILTATSEEMIEAYEIALNAMFLAELVINDGK